MKNPHLVDLYDKMSDRFSVDSVNMSMSDWVTENTTLKGKPFSLKGYEFQREILDDMHPNMDVIKISQVGMALDLNTPIPSPSGWKTMGGLQEGDKVFDENGKVCNVTYTSPIYLNHECYELEFDNGDSIIADAGHRWFVTSDRMFHEKKGFYPQSGRIPKKLKGYKRRGVVTTELIAQQYKKGSLNLFNIPNTKPLEGHHNELPLDPYFLGLWLGDGHSYSTRITMSITDHQELIAELTARNFIGIDKSNKPTVKEIKFELKSGNKRGESLYSILSNLKVIQNKHVPDIYLTANKEFRLELLQGLMDTDGSITKRGRCYFHNTNIELVKAVEYLATSLGFKTRTRWRNPPEKPYRLKDGGSINSKLPIAEVSFVSYKDTPVFKIKRKRDRLKDKNSSRPSESLRRKIVKVTKVDTVPVKCISVDSPNHLFLAGQGMIPTHNTEIQIRKALAFLKRNNGTSLIFSLPDETMFERVSKTRVKPIVDHDKVFTTEYDNMNKAIRSLGIKQFGQSFLYLTPTDEKAATSIDADVIFNDELDLSDQHMIGLFNSRMQNSDWKVWQRFSTPTFPAYGIDLNYKSTDQKEYSCKCQACGHYNFPKFNKKFIKIPGLPKYIKELTDLRIEDQDDIDLNNSYVMCEKCQRPLDLGNPELREWVPFYPTRSKDARGYRISPFVTDRLDVKYIIQSLWRFQKQEFKRGFYNTVLGMPYSDGSMMVPEEEIRKCFQRERLQEKHFSNVWVGIDMGQTCHITLGEGNSEDDLRIFNMYSVPVTRILKEVVHICEKYPVRGGSCDRHPYEPTARQIFEISKGKILPIEYRGSKEINLVKNEHQEITHGQVNRTLFLDHFATRVRNQNINIFVDDTTQKLFIEHMRDMVRDEEPDKPAVWKKLNNNDHYFHSGAFMAYGPKIKQAVLAKEKTDKRSTVLISGVSMEDTTPNLIGMSNKKVERDTIIM